MFKKLESKLNNLFNKFSALEKSVEEIVFKIDKSMDELDSKEEKRSFLVINENDCGPWRMSRWK